MFCSILEIMVLSCNWFFRHGVIMMAVSKWGWSAWPWVIWKRERGENRKRDLKTRRKDILETQLGIYLTDSLTKLKAEYNTLLGIASNPQLSIFQSLYFRHIYSNTSLVYLNSLGLINTLHILAVHITLSATFAPESVNSSRLSQSQQGGI